MKLVDVMIAGLGGWVLGRLAADVEQRRRDWPEPVWVSTEHGMTGPVWLDEARPYRPPQPWQEF